MLRRIVTSETNKLHIWGGEQVSVMTGSYKMSAGADGWEMRSRLRFGQLGKHKNRKFPADRNREDIRGQWREKLINFGFEVRWRSIPQPIKEQPHFTFSNI